jgi:hypothetical protein
MIFAASSGITIMIMSLVPTKYGLLYAHPELLKPTEEHLIFFMEIGGDKKGMINGIILKRFQELSEQIKGSENSINYLEQSGLPRKINIFKKYPLDDYIIYLQNLKKNLDLDTEELYDSMVSNYYSKNPLGKLIKHINKKQIVDAIARSYKMITTKGHLIMIKITDDRAILNFYVETKYRELLELILGLYRVELNMYGKKCKVISRELTHHGDAVCYRIVVNFLS